MLNMVIPGALTKMNSELRIYKERSQRLERRVQRMESDMKKLKSDPFFYPFWATKDWEKAYGDDERGA